MRVWTIFAAAIATTALTMAAYPASASENLSDAQIRQVVTGHRLVYPDGYAAVYRRGGKYDYEAPSGATISRGRWYVSQGRACVQFPRGARCDAISRDSSSPSGYSIFTNGRRAQTYRIMKIANAR